MLTKLLLQHGKEGVYGAFVVGKRYVQPELEFLVYLLVVGFRGHSELVLEALAKGAVCACRATSPIDWSSRSQAITSSACSPHIHIQKL